MMSLALCINKCQMRNIHKMCHEFRGQQYCLELKCSEKSLKKKETIPGWVNSVSKGVEVGMYRAYS